LIEGLAGPFESRHPSKTCMTATFDPSPWLLAVCGGSAGSALLEGTGDPLSSGVASRDRGRFPGPDLELK